MPAERFYINADLIDPLFLEGTEFHHLAHVMRIRVGEEIELVNGRGALATAKVTALTKHGANLTLLSMSQTPVAEPNFILAIPLMRPSKLEFVIEKGTELGADAFWLYPAQYSDKEDLTSHQLERLSHIATSAMKQCGRLDLPAILVLPHFGDLFGKSFTYLFGDTRPHAKPLTPQAKVVLITGPEKGFSEKELQQLDRHATGVRLHRNILRAETAPIAGLCIMIQ